jgi:hypothetical protein
MTDDRAKAISAVIALLESVRPVPHMYMVRHDPDLAVAFLRGIAITAERLLGICTDGELRCRVWEAHGWERGARGPVPQMQRAGLTDEAIVDELLAIEIETWKRFASGESS